MTSALEPAATSAITAAPPAPDVAPLDAPASDLLAHMESLMAQTHDTNYPVMPHTPVVVAAASCQDVVLRWQSVDDAAWPVDEYILQRFPNTQHDMAWETLVATEARNATDRRVRYMQQYLYRVQAVSGASRSAYVYHTVRVDTSSCPATRSLADYLPRSMGVIPYLDAISMEAVQTLVLICVCFLAVFAAVRSNITRVQHTRSREGRLREMQKSAALAERHSSSLLRASSSASSTELSTSQGDVVEKPLPSTVVTPRRPRRVSIGAISEIESHHRMHHPRSSSNASASSTGEATHCLYCRKKFGVFRRRRICDVCGSVALCRKCSVQAPEGDAAVRQLRESMPASHPEAATLRRRRSGSLKTVCRDCNAQSQRLSVSPDLRPTLMSSMSSPPEPRPRPREL